MRQTEIRPTGNTALPADLALNRNEPRRLLVIGFEAAPLVMTIATTSGDALLIEITGTGAIDLLPELLQVLAEGEYYYNLWHVPPDDARELVARGRLQIARAITPTGVDAATVFLTGFGEVSGITCLVALTAADYAAIAAPDPTILYIVR